MCIIPSALILLLVPAGFLGPVDIQIPEEWTVDCHAIDESGRLLVGCSRWNSDAHIHEVIILVAGESIDTIQVNDERIISLSSLCATSDGGYLITCPVDLRSMLTAAARLSQSGSVEWFTSTGHELEVNIGNSNAFAELPGGGLIMGGNLSRGSGWESYQILLMDEQGSLLMELEGDLDEEVEDVMADNEGFLLVGEMPGSDQTQAFARRFSLEGDMIWELCCDPGMFSGFDCAAAVNDGYLMGGTVSPCEGPMSGLVVRADAAGNEAWRNIVQPDSGYQQVYIRSLMEIDEGSVLAGGFCVADNAPRNTNDALIVFLDSDGSELEREIFKIPGQNHEEFFGLYKDAEGNVSVYCMCRGEAYNKRYFVMEL